MTTKPDQAAVAALDDVTTTTATSSQNDKTRLESALSADTITADDASKSGKDLKKSSQGEGSSVMQVTDNDVEKAQNTEGLPSIEDGPVFVEWTLATLIPLFVGLISAHFLAALDATIVSTTLGAVSIEFNAFDQISWVATAYVLTFNSFQPIVGKFAQIFGHRIMTMAGIIIFVLGSAGCGASKHIDMLIAFRGLQGVGGATLLSMILICISDMFPLEKRPKYLTVLWINFGVSTIIGPLLGGVFTDKLSWRWAFYVNVPVGIIAFFLVFAFLRIPFKAQSFSEQWRRIDFLGTVLLVIAVFLILMPTSLGGTQWAWSSPQVIVCYILAAVGIAALVYHEVYRAAEPIIPPLFFKNRNVVACYLTNFFQGMCFFAFVFYGPLYFQIVNGDSATDAGLKLLPLLLGLVVFSIVGTALLPVVKSYKPFIIIGSACITAGAAWFSTLDDTASRVTQISSLLLVGVGLGFSIQMVILTVQSSVSQADTGNASALAGFFQSIGGGIGLAILSSVFNTALVHSLGGLPDKLQNYLNAAAASGGGGSYSGLHNLPGLTSDESQMIIHAYAQALQQIYRYAIPFGVLSFIAPWFIGKTVMKSPEEMMAAGPSH